MAENTTASRRVQAAAREKAAFALRIAGATYAQIGAQLGVTGCAAHKMVKRVLERTRGETDAEAVELRRLETERLDALQVALWCWALFALCAAALWLLDIVTLGAWRRE